MLTRILFTPYGYKTVSILTFTNWPISFLKDGKIITNKNKINSHIFYLNYFCGNQPYSTNAVD